MVNNPTMLVQSLVSQNFVLKDKTGLSQELTIYPPQFLEKASIINMTNTKKFKFNSPKDSFAENIKSKEFKNYEFPSFKIKSNCSGSYLLYFNDKVEFDKI